jgi:hypothetical protein
LLPEIHYKTVLCCVRNLGSAEWGWCQLYQGLFPWR